MAIFSGILKIFRHCIAKARITQCGAECVAEAGDVHNEAVAQMDTMTQQNAAMMEELAATAQSLSSQVKEVSDSMRLFRLRPGELTVSQTDAVGLRRDHKMGNTQKLVVSARLLT